MSNTTTPQSAARIALVKSDPEILNRTFERAKRAEAQRDALLAALRQIAIGNHWEGADHIIARKALAQAEGEVKA